MSKFFAIIVEDAGDETGKVFADARKFMVHSKIDLPEECEFLSCVEVSPEQVNRLLAGDESREHIYHHEE
ncbi:MAG TPA: hypothetical protein VKZ53_10145 [Candidatus Angelobacter sp.]|nr:hypothetical protein [Candidatus Angelobacter sp.]